MSRIRSRDTKPEMIVRKAVWAAGFRYRLHHKDLPGRPDLTFPAFRTVVFVHGCYWHGHSCQKGRVPGRNSEFWKEKFETNVARDKRNQEALERAGWKVATVWECSLATKEKREKAIHELLGFLSEARENARRALRVQSGRSNHDLE